MVRIILYHRPECKYCKQLVRILDGICEDLSCNIIYRDIDYNMKYPIPDLLISENGAVIVPDEVKQQLETASPILEIEAVLPTRVHRITIVGFTSDYEKIKNSVIILRKIIASLRELEKNYLF